MAIVALEELKIPPGQRLLGLDLGEKTIGLALSDTLLSIATPMQTLKRGKFAADAIQLSWDRSLGGSRTVLYLGLLPPGLTLNIALLVRVDEQIDAPDCFTDHMSLPVNTTIHHCHEQLEALSLPAKRTSAGTRLDVNVYSR